MVAWIERFLPVRSSGLHIEDTLQPTDRATDAQLRSYVRNVDELFSRLAAGATPERLAALRTNGATPHERMLGETYQRMFTAGGRDHRIEAEWTGGRLVVQRGRHRVDAAQREGVPFLPVRVRAADEATMRVLAERLERDAAVLATPREPAERAAAGRAWDGHPARSEGDAVTFGSEGGPRGRGPEFEPQPRSFIPEERARDEATTRAVGRQAVQGATRSAEDARKDRLDRALGRIAAESAQTRSRERE